MDLRKEKKIKQARAIWYSCRKKKLAKQREYLEKNGLVEEFKNSKYKTMTWFLNSKGVNI